MKALCWYGFRDSILRLLSIALIMNITKVLISLCFVSSLVVERRVPRFVNRGGLKNDCEKFQFGIQNRPLWYKGLIV